MAKSLGMDGEEFKKRELNGQICGLNKPAKSDLQISPVSPEKRARNGQESKGSVI